MADLFHQYLGVRMRKLSAIYTQVMLCNASLNRRKEMIEIRMHIGLLLTLQFILLKVTGGVEWSWLWVLSPLWISILFIFVKVVYESFRQ